MPNPVPPFRIVIPCVQIYLLLLAVCSGLLGLMYADTSFLNGVVMPATAFTFWGAVPCWMFVRLMKYHFTITPAQHSAILWTLPAFSVPLGVACYLLCMPLIPFIFVVVLLVGFANIFFLIAWYWVFHRIFRRYYERNPWAAY